MQMDTQNIIAHESIASKKGHSLLLYTILHTYCSCFLPGVVSPGGNNNIIIIKNIFCKGVIEDGAFYDTLTKYVLYIILFPPGWGHKDTKSYFTCTRGRMNLLRATPALLIWQDCLTKI